MSVLQKNKKAAVGVGVAAAAAAVLALGAGTFAAFSDTETGPGGTLAAGTLDLEVGGAPNQATLLDIGNIEPGQDLAPITLTVKNTGTLDGVLSGRATITGTDGVCSEPEKVAEGGSCAANGNLQDQLTVSALGQTLPLPLVTGVNIPGSVVIPAGQERSLTVDFSLPDRPDNNEVQGDTLKIATELTLVQQ